MMIFRFVIFAALGLLALVNSAWAATSTINPTLPAPGLPYTSSVIRNNFQAAANDINALLSTNGVGGPTTSIVNDLPLWNSTTGNKLSDPGNTFSVAGNVLQVPQIATTPLITWSGSSSGAAALAGIWQQENLSGTSSAGNGAQLSANLLAATDNLIAPPPIYAMSLWDVEDTIGTGAQGARNAIKAWNTVQATPTVKGTPGDNYPAYVGVFPGGYLDVNLGGIATSPLSSTAGSLYGMNPNVTLGPNATNIYGVIGQENDITVESGASVGQKIGIDIIQASTDAERGSVVDAAIMLFNQPGAVGWNCGLCFGGNGSGGAFPINPTGGTMIGTVGSSGMSALNGADFSAVSISGCAFKSNFFCVSGSGSITGDNIQWNGHLLPSTGVAPTAPTYTCGSPCTATGSDSDGTVTPGSSVSSVGITFAFAWPSAPACTVTGFSTSGSILAISGAPTATAITVTQYNSSNTPINFTGTDGFTYHCMD